MQTKRISADEAHNLRKDQMRQGASGAELMLKAARAPSTWDPASRSARFVMSSQATDRSGDIVVTAGLDTTQFERNPIGLLSHRSGAWPIGDWQNMEKMLRGRPPRMEGDLVLHKTGGPIPEIDQAAWMIENGYMRGASIGFIPDFDQVEMLMAEDGSWTGGLQFNKAEIVECSLCGIPANPDALAKMAGGNIALAKECLEEVLDNWARSPEGAVMSRAEFEKAWRVLESGAVDSKAPGDLAAAERIVRDSADAARIIKLAEEVVGGSGEDNALRAWAERIIAADGDAIVSPERVERLERAAKQARLEQARRQRKLNLIHARSAD